MYTAYQNIGDFGDRPLFENWSYTQDAGGGNIKRLDSSFNLWALVEDANSSQFVAESKQQWTFELKITTRYNFYIFPTTTIIWNNSRYSINSITQTDDRFVELRCSKLQGNLAGGVLKPFTMAYVYNFTATGGELGFTNPSLIGKTLLGVFKDGIAYKIITTGTPAPKEVKYTSTTGAFEFGDPFFDDEVAIVQYI